ncbi:unnamed protein product [Adineta ricciae]|uniref:Uncharacterized protein n=1 Tax=Adineta ricciae TaxID=249248 RepID=A0A816HD53_ADIRI|nr:unnamed protein product [Adineta ricciae]
MSERFLTVNGIHKKKGMIKTYSFTTDDDEAKPGTDLPLINNHDKSLPQVSPTNENVSSESDESCSNATLQKRKSLRQKESPKMNPKRVISPNKSDQSKSIDLRTILLLLGTLVFLYFTWTKRDIWISRLILSSRVKINHAHIVQTSTKSSMNVSDGKSELNEPPVITSTKSNTSDHATIKIRRTKMTFGTDPPKKKLVYVPERSPDKTKPVISVKHHSPTLSTTKQNSHCYRPLNSSTDYLTYTETVRLIRTNLTSKNGHRSMLPTVMTKTGLNKYQLYRFLYKKNDNVLSLETFLSLLDIFDMQIFIQSK